MANRSYLFSTDRAPAKVIDRGTYYDGVGEWSYHTPALALLLVSEDCKIGVSVLDPRARQDASGAMVSVPNLYGRGLARTLKLLRIMAHLAQKTGDTILQAEVEDVRAHLTDMGGPVLVLELVELFQMSSDDPAHWASEADYLRQQALDLGQAVDALPDSMETAARELGAMLDDGGMGPLSKLTLSLARDDRQRDSAALGLGGFAETLYFNPIPREAFLAETSERLRQSIILPKVAALDPAPPTDWALLVERTFSDVRDDGTNDRRYAFLLVTQTPGFLGLSKRHTVVLDPEIEEARLTAARLLEWQIESTRDLRTIAIRPDGICHLPGTGQARELVEGTPTKALLKAIFQPLPPT